MQLQALCAIACAWRYLAHHHGDGVEQIPGIARGRMTFSPKVAIIDGRALHDRNEEHRPAAPYSFREGVELFRVEGTFAY